MRHKELKHLPPPSLTTEEFEKCLELARAQILEKKSWGGVIHESIQIAQLHESALGVLNTLLKTHRILDEFQPSFGHQMPEKIKNINPVYANLLVRSLGKIIIAFVKAKKYGVSTTSSEPIFLTDKDKDVSTYMAGFCFRVRYDKYAKLLNEKFKSFESTTNEKKREKIEVRKIILQSKMNVLRCVKIEKSDDARHNYTIACERNSKKHSLWLVCDLALNMFEAIELELLPLFKQLPTNLADHIDSLTSALFNESYVISLIEFIQDQTGIENEIIENILEDVIALYIRSRVHRHLKDFNQGLHKARKLSLRKRLQVKSSETN